MKKIRLSLVICLAILGAALGSCDQPTASEPGQSQDADSGGTNDAVVLSDQIGDGLGGDLSSTDADDNTDAEVSTDVLVGTDGGGCQTSADCNDGLPCTTDTCNAGTCKNVQAAAGSSCDDGEPCSADDKCNAKGECIGGPEPACDDGSTCTEDSCKAGYGCVNKLITGTCDDGSACTENDACSQGKCAGKAVVCNDNNTCTVDSCDPLSGCKNTKISGSCDDGNPCTVSDVCAAGVCQSGPNACACQADADCAAKEDSNLCNGTLYCDKSAAPYVCKVNPATVITCDSGSATACSSFGCDPKQGKCAASDLPDGTPCDADGSVCTASDACAAGTCLAGKLQTCDDNNACTDDSCNAAAGCIFAANTLPCNADDTACTVGDACLDKVCKAGPTTACNDQNPCTLDTCDAVTGKCKYDVAAMEAKSCDADQDACTVGDACSSGVCVVGSPKICDDNNPCTGESCDKTTGCVVINVAGPCDTDSNACTQDQCAAGLCAAGTSKVCNDNNSCTVDSCNTASGLCVYDPLPQDGKSCDADGTICTEADTCQTGTCVPGTKAGQGTPCDDGKACTEGDTCNGQGGCTPGAAKGCEDNNVCTVDACSEVAGGCTNIKLAMGTACNDGVFCTVGETCNGAGACGGGAALDCSAGGCTLGSCNEQLAKCEGTSKPDASPCDADGDACTVSDTCTGGVCIAGTKKTCDDNKGCTVDSCNAATGTCVFDAATNNGKPCDADGNICTEGDACQADGSCKAGAAANAGKPCDDGNPCTISDGCSGNALASCLPGSAKSCDDGNPCTADSCNTGSGTCVHEDMAPGAECDDGLYCTVGETCNAGGVCGSGSAKVCGEGGCILGTCDEAKNACVGQTLPDGTLCNSDNNGCTKNDFCQTGVCQAGAPVNCFVPGDTCNTYSCNSSGHDTYQCTSAPALIGTTCDDLLYCTVGDSCDGEGVCKSGVPRNCSAKDSSCTTGTCDENANTCVATNKTDGITCSLGNVCTTGDVCKSGFCIAGTNTCPGGEDFRAGTSAGNSTYGPPAMRQFAGGDMLLGWLNVEKMDSIRVRNDLSRKGWLDSSTGISIQNSPAAVLGTDLIYWRSGNGETLKQGTAPAVTTGGALVGDMYWEFPIADQQSSNNCCSYNASCSGSTSKKPWTLGCVLGSNTNSWNSCTRWACLSPAGIAKVSETYYPTVTADISQEESIVYRDLLGSITKWNGAWGSSLVGTIQPASLAAFQDGTFLAVWLDGSGQKYAKDGKLDGGKFVFNTTPFGASLSSYYEWPISVQTLPNGRYVVAWQSFDKSATQSGDIRAQLFKNEPGAKAGSELLVNTSLLGNQGRPRIAAFSDSSFAIIWQDDSGRDGNGKGIVGQWYSPAGKPIGGEVVINSTTTGDQVLPNVSVDLTSDLAAIAWIDNGDGGHVKLARYGRNGKRDNGILEQLVNETKTGEQQQPQLASPRVTNLQLGDGSFMATWASENVDGSGYAVMAKRYGVDGKAKGVQFQVNTTTDDSQWQPDAAMDQAGNYIVVWNSVGQDGDLDGVYAQRYLNTGTKNGTEFRVPVQTVNEQTRPKVAMQATGAFAVAFETYGPSGGSGYDVGLRCFNAAGTALSQDVLVNQFTTGAQTRPQIAAAPDGSGRYFVTWQSYDQLGTGKQDDVYARIYNGSCQPVGDAFLVNTLTDGSEGMPSIEANLDGAFTITWQQYDNANEGLNIWAQRYTTTGATDGAAFLVHEWTKGSQTEPAVTYLPDGSFVITYVTAGEDEEGTAVKAVKFDSSAVKTDVEWFANRTYVGAQAQCAVVGRPNGTWVYAWTSAGQDGDAGSVVLRTSNSGECMSDNDCNDQNICTDDKCNAGKCQTTNNQGLCTTDNNACTTGDTCADGVCQGTPVTCNDNNVCTADSCDGTTGECKFTGIAGCSGGCFYSDAPGCDGCQCEAAVCSERPGCCTGNWDSLCVQLCNQKYGGCDSGL